MTIQLWPPIRGLSNWFLNRLASLLEPGFSHLNSYQSSKRRSPFAVEGIHSIGIHLHCNRSPSSSTQRFWHSHETEITWIDLRLWNHHRVRVSNDYSKLQLIVDQTVLTSILWPFDTQNLKWPPIQHSRIYPIHLSVVTLYHRHVNFVELLFHTWNVFRTCPSFQCIL